MSQRVLQVRDLTVSYPCDKGGKVSVLKGVSFALKPGETVALVGRSGCGKSTLSKALLRLIESDGGSICLDGRDVTHAMGAERRAVYRTIQMVFQNPVGSFDPRRTLGDGIGESLRNAGVGADECRRRVAVLLERCGLPANFALRYPSQVSGGQCQRAAIARALVQRARVLLADEPIASLDPESARNVMQTLRDLNQKDGLTVVVTLHQVDYAMRFCPRTVALKKGEIVYDGPTERLTPQFLAELYGAESDELFAAKTSAAQEAVTLPGTPVRETSRAA